jgi:putative transposase
MNNIPFEEGKYYHVFNRGNNKENLFVEERNYQYFLQKSTQYLLPIVDVYSYCLMPNHFHLVIRIKNYEALPSEYKTGNKKLHQPFSNLFNSYAKSINKIYKRTGSLFQEHLHRIEITNEEYLQDVILYTHLNPVKHKFTTDYKSYAHSSYSALSRSKETHLKRKEVMNLFHDLDNFNYCHEKRLYKILERLKEIEALDTF